MWVGRVAQTRISKARQNTTPHWQDKGGTRTRSTRDSGALVGEGHPGVGEVYHLSLLCGEAWMDSSCQTSIYRAAWRNSPPRPECTLSPQRHLLTALLHWWTSPASAAWRQSQTERPKGRSNIIHLSVFGPNLWALTYEGETIHWTNIQQVLHAIGQSRQRRTL